jgi:hypothetical protein
MAQQLDWQDNAVLDPACGCGHLLIAMALNNPRSPHLFLGWDNEVECVAATRISLWIALQRAHKVTDFHGIRQQDALFSKPEVEVGALIANPPFQSIRSLSRIIGRDYITKLKSTELELKGNFDLFVAFLLSIPRWVNPGIGFAIIVPRTYWHTDYAAPARQTIVPYLTAVHEFDSRTLFPRASVSTDLLLGTCANEKIRGRINTEDLPVSSLSETKNGLLQKTDSCFKRHLPITALYSDETGEDWVPLGEVADISAGTAGYVARKIAFALKEDHPLTREKCLPFIVSRSIDPYEITKGTVRFLGQTYQKPVLPLSALTAGKKALFKSEKVVLAGIFKRFEAALDREGLALGVGVYCVRSKRLPLELLLAWLNSSPLSQWYRYYFRGREMAGGYFAVNCTQLKNLPIPRSWLNPRCSLRKNLITLAKEREQCNSEAIAHTLDQQIDRLVSDSLGKSISIPFVGITDGQPPL